MTKKKKHVYRIKFINLETETVDEIYCGKIASSPLAGFLEVEDFLFGEVSALVIDPTEERLKNEFSAVEVSFIPMQHVVRIDRVAKEGAPTSSKLTEAGSNISTLFSGTPKL